MDSIYLPPCDGASDEVALTADEGHGPVVAWLKIGNGPHSGLIRDEARTLVDFLIEALEEHDERNKPKPAEKVEVGKAYVVLEDYNSHGFPVGQVVKVLATEFSDLALATVNEQRYPEWTSDPGTCRRVFLWSLGDLDTKVAA